MKNKIKRSAIALLALALAISALAGCGGKGSKNAGEGESDLAYVKEMQILKIGITIFDPMNYYDPAGKLIGFDTEFAEAVCKEIGVVPEFIEINWDTKETELASKTIDCIWNGLTVTEDRKQNMLFSDSYIKNMQVVVIRVADQDKYTSTESLAGALLCAEIGSAGETAIKEDDVLKGAKYTAAQKQTDTLLEVMAGTNDAAVLDYTAARANVGPGTDYANLMIVPGIELAAEEYAIGFRLGSDVVPEVNAAIAKLAKDGTLDAIAEKYELTASLLSNQ